MRKDLLYEAMKAAAKQRKFKASPQHDLYKKDGPYFYHIFYAFDPAGQRMQEAGTVGMILDITLKYCRFDELRWGIISPGSGLKFTDKVRANSVTACRAAFPRKSVVFRYDGSEAGLPQLCADILDWSERFYAKFFETLNQEYGTLEAYYLAHKEDTPLLAGLVYIERGQYKEAEECFRLPNMDCKHSCTPIYPVTEEQKTRARASCERPNSRSDYERLLDYTIAMQYHVEWTEETANYGLLPEERHGK